MSQKYLIRIAELERLLSEQAEALRQKDQQLSLVEETEAFLRSALTRAEEKIEEDEREIEAMRCSSSKTETLADSADRTSLQWAGRRSSGSPPVATVAPSSSVTGTPSP